MDKMNVSLTHNKAFTWFKSDSLFFKGYFYVDNTFYEKENAINYLSNIKENKDFKETLNSINGVFTIIISIRNILYIASDITRSFPIFYTFQNEKIFLSDDMQSKESQKDYGIGAQILNSLNVKQIKLMTSGGKHSFVGLNGFGLEIIEEIQIEC